MDTCSLPYYCTQISIRDVQAAATVRHDRWPDSRTDDDLYTHVQEYKNSCLQLGLTLDIIMKSRTQPSKLCQCHSDMYHRDTHGHTSSEPDGDFFPAHYTYRCRSMIVIENLDHECSLTSSTGQYSRGSPRQEQPSKIRLTTKNPKIS